MQEDIEGTMRSLGGRHFGVDAGGKICSLCGQPYPARTLTLRDGDEAEGVRSEYEEICPECGRLLALGEEPAFPLDEE